MNQCASPATATAGADRSGHSALARAFHRTNVASRCGGSTHLLKAGRRGFAASDPVTTTQPPTEMSNATETVGPTKNN
jgi:hypothetical protein